MYMPYLKSLMGTASKEIENSKVIKQKIIPKYYGLNKQKTSNTIERKEDQSVGTITSEVEVEDFCLLNDGAMILVDNTLWKGLVLSQVRSLSYPFFSFLFFFFFFSFFSPLSFFSFFSSLFFFFPIFLFLHLLLFLLNLYMCLYSTIFFTIFCTI